MTTIAITGATGFVGSALARALAGKGAKIIGLVRPSSNRETLADLDVRWVEGDVTDATSLKGAFIGADWLVHAAGILGRAGISEAQYRRVNVDGTRNILAESTHCRRVLYVSTPGVLGPIYGQAADETAPLAPSNRYERSKAAAEDVVKEFFRGGKPVIIARPEFIYGPGDTHVLGLFTAIQRGTFFYVAGGRNYCHPTFVEDAVDGLVRCLQRGVPGNTYHLTGPRPVTFRELAETIAAALGVRDPRISLPKSVAWIGAAMLESVTLLGLEAPLSRSGVAFFSENRRFKSEKAAAELAYHARFDLAAGVERTVAWYRRKGLL